MKLLCIDPGGSGKGTTGVVVINAPDDGTPTLESSVAIEGGIEGFLHYDVPQLIRDADHVVVERFVNRNVHGADLTPVLIEGSVLTLCTLFQTDYTRQVAAGKNTMMPDTILKLVGMYSFTRDNHHDRREAARHGLIWLRNNYHVPTLRLLTEHLSH